MITLIQQTPAPPTPTFTPAPPALIAPAVRREFRGVWVATVGNIDWPSRPGLSTDAQKAELLAILDRAVALHLNAVIFQVRPASDALYASPYEPWSEYLTGTMGKAPEPLYDPLQFAVDEAHKRGLELHAWFNPYRVRSTAAATPASDNYITKTHPERVRQYGKQQWLDPGLPEVREYSLKVIIDVVTRYDVDAVHVDDYFYPYPENGPDGKTIPFPDTASYAAYKQGGGTLPVEDWRRDNVTGFIRELYTRIHTAKAWVKLGISPFGIPKPGVPAQIKGFDARAELYGDAVQWLNNGWCDYFSPQLYWPIDQTPQSFPVLLGAWIAENKKSRHLWPGLFTSKYAADEITFQVKTTRGYAGATGNVHFSMNSLMPTGPNSMGDLLARNVYADIAVIPETPWLAPKGSLPPPAPSNLVVTPAESAYVPAVLHWKAGTNPNTSASAPWLWAVQTRTEGAKWQTVVVPASVPTAVALPAKTDAISIRAIDRYGRTGDAATLLLNSPASQ